MNALLRVNRRIKSVRMRKRRAWLRRRATCVTKRRFHSEEQAKEALRCGGAFTQYWCDICNGWHLTSTTGRSEWGSHV